MRVMMRVMKVMKEREREKAISFGAFKWNLQAAETTFCFAIDMAVGEKEPLSLEVNSVRSPENSRNFRVYKTSETGRM